MKRYVQLGLLLFFPFVLNQSLMLAVEGEGKFEIPEKPKEYKDPKTEQEAVDEWDRAEDSEKEAKKAEEESREKFQDAIEKLNKVKGKDEAAQKEYNDWLKKWADAKEAVKDWSERKDQLTQNELVKQYVKRLGDIYEKPTATFEEPGWWAKLRKGIDAWVKERQIDYYSWIGNKEKVLQARLDVADIYAQLGKGGLLDKARTNKELSGALDELDKKIGKNLSALEDYAQAIEKGKVSKKNEEAIKKEVKEVLVDLATLKNELETAGFDDKVRDIIDKKINKTIEDFGITEKEQKELEEKTKEKTNGKDKLPEPPASPKEIRELAMKIGSMRIESDPTKQPAWQEALEKDPKNFMQSKEFYDFVVDLDRLSRVDFSKVPEALRPLYRQYVSDGFKNLHSEMIKEVFNIEKTPAEDRAMLLARANEIYPKYTEAAKQWNEEFKKVREQYAVEESAEDKQEDLKEKDIPTKPLKPGTADRFERDIQKNLYVEKVLNKVRENDSQGLDREYFNTFDAVMTAWGESVEKAAVNQESIDVREKSLEYYKELLEGIREYITKYPQSDYTVSSRVMLDVMIKLKQLEQGLGADKAVMVILKEEGDKLTGELLKERPRISEEKQIAQQDAVSDVAKERSDQMRDGWQNLTAADKKDLMLTEIKMGIKLKKKKTPFERAKNIDDFVGLVTQEVKEQKVELSPEVKKKLRTATTDTQLKNAVAELTYESAKQALKKVATKEPLAPKDWWNEYIETGPEKGSSGVPGGNGSGVPG